jgi:two-component system sensor histidine kinase/response regulator
MPPDLINVLLIEDDEDDYMILRDLISKIENAEYRIEWMSTPEEALHDRK